MMGHRFAVTAFTILALAAGSGRVSAQEEERNKAEGTRFNRLEGLEAKLGLNDQQKQDVGKIQADFERKAEPLEQQLWKLHTQEHAAMCKVLSEQQRTKVRDVVKEVWQAEAQKIAARLNLTDDQKQQVRKIHEEYGPKFCALMEKEDADTFKEGRELRSRALKELRGVLTADQRAMLPGIMHHEFQRMHDAANRREQMKTIADKLELSNDQREQLQKLQADYNRQMEQPTAQFKQIHEDEVASISKVLTPEQRAKFEAAFKAKRD